MTNDKFTQDEIDGFTLEPLPGAIEGIDYYLEGGELTLLGCFKVTGQTVNYLIEAMDSENAIKLFEEITGQRAVISEAVPYPSTHYVVDDLGVIQVSPLPWNPSTASFQVRN